MGKIDKKTGEEGKLHLTGNWKRGTTELIHSKLEIPNWAPWLAASKESLLGRSKVFPKGQLVTTDIQGNPLASLSMNRISWNGNPLSLPSWDMVAGEPTTYERTYQPQGNALVMMSMNVDPLHQGEGLAKRLIEQAKLLAIELGVEYIIGSFRPNEFGKYKAMEGKQHTTFREYISKTRDDGLPIDGWIRNLYRNGMKPIQIDAKAMTVTIPIEEFFNYQKTYNVGSWKEVSPGIWECGEVGSWQINYANSTATYQESNLWGIVWEKNGLK